MAAACRRTLARRTWGASAGAGGAGRRGSGQRRGLPCRIPQLQREKGLAMVALACRVMDAGVARAVGLEAFGRDGDVGEGRAIGGGCPVESRAALSQGGRRHGYVWLS